MASRRTDPLTGMRVLALGTGVSTYIAASWLAQAGADVARFKQPAPGAEEPTRDSVEAAFLRQVMASGRDASFERDAPYDVVLAEATDLDALLPVVPDELKGNATTIEVTSPARAADFDETLVTNMQLFARSGLGALTREIDENWHFGQPCLPVNRQASILAGIAAATAAVTAVLGETCSFRPQRLSLDQFELLALIPMQPVATAQLAAPRPPGPRTNRRRPGGTMESANGMAFVGPVELAHWAALLRVVGGLDWAADQVEANPEVLLDSCDDIDRRLRDWARARSTEEIADTCQAAHIPVAPVYRPDQIVDDPHLRARGFFAGSKGGRLNPPWLAAVGAADPNSPDAGTSVALEGKPVRPRNPEKGPKLPLAGLRILDLSWAWAGPFATTLLSDLGAEAVNIEWHPRASNLRRNPPFAGNRPESNNTAGWWSANHRGKLSVGVDLKAPEGKQIVRDLAARCDVVVENFSPGVVERLGIHFEDLVRFNPRLVYVSLSAFGQTGPRSHYIGYGTQLYAASGAGFATSQDGNAFSQMSIPYPDPVSGLVGAFAAAAFVRSARVTGRPAKVDVSELEAIAAIILEPLLLALDGKPSALPWRRYVVATTSDTRHVALLARTEADWHAYRQALDADSSDPDALRAAATRLSSDELLAIVSHAGLTAAPIPRSGDVLADPYLVERAFWTKDMSPEVAPTGARIGGPIWHVDGERARIWRGAPPLFTDTRAVLADILGYDTERIEGLFASGAVE